MAKDKAAAKVAELHQSLPDSQYLIVGQSATRKSSTVATFPKPLLVHFWDSPGQSRPYLNRGIAKPLAYDDLATPYHEVVSKKSGQLLIRVEYYNDPDPMKPNALQRWLKRIDRLRNELSTWRSYCNDSVTGMTYNGYSYMRRVVNHDTSTSIARQQHWDSLNGIASVMKEQLYSRLLALPFNVVTVAHMKEVTISRGRNIMDTRVMRIHAPGEMQQELASQYPECWFTYLDYDDHTKENIYLIQTEGEMSDGLNAKSQFQIQGPVEVGRGRQHQGYLAMVAAPNGIGDNWE